MYVVVVTFKIKPDCIERFLPLMLDNAKASLDKEQGCSQFDVCVDDNEPETVFLYELYAHRAAFDEHLASAHFIAFDSAVASMVETKQVQTFTKVSS